MKKQLLPHLKKQSQSRPSLVCPMNVSNVGLLNTVGICESKRKIALLVSEIAGYGRIKCRKPSFV